MRCIYNEYIVFCRSMNVLEDVASKVIFLFTKYCTCVRDVLLPHQILSLTKDNFDIIHNTI